MPWLALPFKDPKCGVLWRVLGYHFDKYGLERDPTLVIIEPDGRFVEPWGADVIYQFKLPAFPFTCEKVVMLDNEKVKELTLVNEKVKELTLDMLWDRNTIFRRKYGSKVKFTDGTVFDSSFERSDPIEFELGTGEVIKGGATLIFDTELVSINRQCR